MKIRNAIIITEDNSPLQMTSEEMRDFKGNVVLSRSQLPPSFLSKLYQAVGMSTKDDSVSSDTRRPPVQPELAR